MIMLFFPLNEYKANYNLPTALYKSNANKIHWSSSFFLTNFPWKGVKFVEDVL